MKLLCMIAVFLCIPWVASDAQKQDWGNLKRYAEANKELVRKGKQKDRVVFMGNSITEGWVANDAAFFEDNGYVGRGIGRADFFPFPAPFSRRCHQACSGAGRDKCRYQ